MLIKVGSLYLTLGTFTYAAYDMAVIVHGTREAIPLTPELDVELRGILDEAIAAQQSIQSQVELQNAKTAELNEQIKKLAAYEQELQQKEAQLIAAHQAVVRKQNPMIVPPLPPGFKVKPR